MLALIDESTPEGKRGVHYVISSVVLVEERDVCRKRLRELTKGRAKPFHWSSEGVRKRAAMITCIAQLPVCLFTVIHGPVVAHRQHLARAAAIRVILERMEADGVTELLIESRGLQDVDDRQTIIQAQHDGVVSRALAYEFADKSEPLLWLPDAVAGIYSEAETGKAAQPLAGLHQRVHMIEVLRLA